MAVLPTVRFCPRCGAPLENQIRFGEMRPCCPKCGYVHFFDPKVAAAVFIQDGQHVLLIQRAVEPEKGKWALPAGYVDAYEDPRETARREALEETGLDVRVTHLMDVFHSTERPGASIIIVYAAEVLGGEMCPMDDAADIGWFGPDALPELAFDSTHLLVGAWARACCGEDPHQP
jgi:ADP-ribose pyrophosphatase YjhB (NUDIX family)